MVSGKYISFIGGLAILAIVAYFVTSAFIGTIPNDSDTVSDLTLTPLKSSAVSDDAQLTLDSLQKNGELPVVVTSDILGRDDPFVAY